MPKYEYMTLKDNSVYEYTLDDINKLGAEGWRVVQTLIYANGSEATLLERVIVPEIILSRN